MRNLLDLVVAKLMQQVRIDLMVCASKVDKNLDGEDFLRSYLTQWNQYNYKFQDTYAKSILSELPHFEDDEEFISMYMSAVDMWHNELYETMEIHLSQELFKLIKKQRSGHNVDTQLISNVLLTYMEFDSKLVNKQPKQCFGLYEILFEIPFLQNIENDHTIESVQLYNILPIREYIRKALQKILHEQERVACYAHVSTVKKLRKIMSNLWIEKHRDVLMFEFLNLVKTDKCEDFYNVYHLLSLSSINKHCKMLKKIVQNYIKKQGLKLIQDCGEVSADTPLKFGEAILNFYQKYSNLMKIFKNDPDLEIGFGEICKKYVNRVNENTPAKCAEFLAKYCDLLLNELPESRESDKLENMLDDIIVVSQHIEEKDVFRSFYSQLLSRRVLTQTGFNEDLEMSIALKLQPVYGGFYTLQLQDLLNEVDVSNQLDEKFRTHLHKNNQQLDIDFHVRVLPTDWFSRYKSMTLNIVPELECSISSFTSFHETQRKGRKLTWLYHLSRGEIVTHCFKNRYTLYASTLQMAVILRFNHADSYTIQELHKDTGISMNYLMQIVKLLLKSKLLLHQDGGEITSDSTVQLFFEYKNKNEIVKLNSQKKIDRKSKETLAIVDQHRQCLIQATIVRVMKESQLVTQQDLIVRVASQLNVHFHPRVSMVKKCIDILIEKKYMERVSGKCDSYKYLP